jgi:hypothetical protein
MAGTISVIGKARAGLFADHRVFGAVAAQGDLVVLHPRAVQAEDADMADMVMAAGVDAAGDLDLQRADLMLQLQRLEMVAKFLRDGIERAVASAQ